MGTGLWQCALIATKQPRQRGQRVTEITIGLCNCKQPSKLSRRRKKELKWYLWKKKKKHTLDSLKQTLGTIYNLILLQLFIQKDGNEIEDKSKQHQQGFHDQPVVSATTERGKVLIHKTHFDFNVSFYKARFLCLL